MGNPDESKEALRRKKKALAGLESSLTSDDDETPDSGRLSSMQAMQKGAARRRNPEASTQKKKTEGPRPASETDLSTTRKNAPTDRSRQDSHGDNKPTGSTAARHTFSGSPSKPTSSAVPSSSAKTTASGKRKRDSSVKQVPEAYQVFKGLHFYFFPNSAANAARKMRITKAQEYGATWEDEFNDDVTHVIMDKSMRFEFLTKHLQKDRLPAHVIVVSEDYPAQCISFKALLNPRQRQFGVRGYEMPAAAKPASSSSSQSLQLKSAGKAVQARQPGTPVDKGRATPTRQEPSHDDEASDLLAASATTEKSTLSTVPSTAEFDKAIRQARELQHVPLDNDEEFHTRTSSSAGPGTDDEQPPRIPFSRKRRAKPQGSDKPGTDDEQPPRIPFNRKRKAKPQGSDKPGTDEEQPPRIPFSRKKGKGKLQSLDGLETDDEQPPKESLLKSKGKGKLPSSDGSEADDEQPPRGSSSSGKNKGKLQSFEDKFQCMQKHTGSDTKTPNATTIAVLQQMADYYNQVGDEWRTRAYRKAISTLRNHPKKVWTKKEALRLPQIGERLATKIEEIAFTNRLRRLDNAKAEPSDQALQTFMQVYGAGFSQASKWVAAGYTTLDDLLKRADLTDNQRIGIEHYEDFNSRIPKAEVASHGNIVRRTLQNIDPDFEVIVGGSYRRGAETSGDIDILITRPDTGIARIREVILDQLIPNLFAKNFFVAELAATSREDGSKWHGASTIPSRNPKAKANPWRRIDLLLVPSDELGAALIYFTGNDIFNRSMRLLASKKGMRLNQHGLYKDVIRGKGREKLSEGTLVEGKDEKKIFEALGVPWRPPEHRRC